jgi:hypothetical protein
VSRFSRSLLIADMAPFKNALAFAVFALLVSSINPVEAGPLAYGICQTGCNTVVVACYAAAGFTFGTVTAGMGVCPAIIACNVALGSCMAACAAVALTPTP